MHIDQAEIDNDPNVIKDYASSETSSIRKLFKGRMDAVVVDKNYALYQLRHLDLGGSARDVSFLEPPLAIHTVHLAISRRHPRKEQILNQMNRAVCSAITDGTADEIMEKWGFKKVPAPLPPDAPPDGTRRIARSPSSATITHPQPTVGRFQSATPHYSF